MKGLTQRQREILDFIKGFIADRQYSPSYREIMEHFGFSSLGSVYKHLTVLKRKGLITAERKCSRSVSLTEEPTNGCGNADTLAPLIGHVKAGYPIETFAKAQMMTVPAYLASDPEKTYVLRAKGDSLTDECIYEGDLIIVEARQTARPGEFVVATVHHNETLIKRYYPEGQYVRLEGCNLHQQPLIVRNEDIDIQGVVVGLLRLYR